MTQKGYKNGKKTQWWSDRPFILLNTEENSMEGNNKERTEGLELEITEQVQREYVGV